MRTPSKIEFTKESRLEDILDLSISYADIFDKYDIDYGNFGKLTLGEVCESIPLKLATLISELSKKDTNGIVCRNMNEWDVVFLCDFINTNLHHKIKGLVAEFENTFRVLFRKGFIHEDIKKLSVDFAADILSHLKKEQRMLFPYIKHMSTALETGKEIQMAPFGLICMPIKALKREHLQITEMAEILGRILADLNRRDGLLQDEKFELMNTLRKSFKLHIHFENNILFPKAISLEKKIFKSNQNTLVNKSKNKCT